MPTPAASPIDYSDLTVDVEHRDVPTSARAPLPPLQPVRDGVAVTDPVDEHLVDLADVGIAALHAYARKGWRGATDRALVRSGVAERLQRVAAALPDELSLVVFDAWRSATLQRELVAYAGRLGATGFVSPVSDDPRHPPPHLTGGTVDLTLAHRGVPLALGTPFDDFSPRAHTDAFEDRPGPVRDLRRELFWAMHAEGFVVYDLEWWHFEHGTSRWATVRGSAPRYGPATP